MTHEGENGAHVGRVAASAGITVESEFQDAVLLHQRGRVAEARDRYLHILKAYPRHDRALNLLGVIELEAQRPQSAIELIAKSVEIQPLNFAAHVNLGNAHCANRAFESGLASYEKALRLNASAPQVHNNHGNALRELKKREAALAAYDRAIALDARYFQAHLNRGLVLLDLGRSDEALLAYEAALALESRAHEAWVGRGNALRNLRRVEPALECYQRALSLRPNDAQALNCMAITLAAGGYFAQAIEYFNRAIELSPDDAGLRHNLGNALHKLKRYRAAAASYGAAYRLKPSAPGVLGALVHTRMQLCDWESFETNVADLTTRILRGEHAASPLTVLGLSDSAVLQKCAARTESTQHLANAIPGSVQLVTPASHKLRIAYYSADFHAHATSYLIAELFELHDRSRFEVSAYSFGPDASDDMRQRIVAGCDRFVDVRSRSDAEVAQLSRSQDIDIAIDLKGYTTGCRPGIFASRAAPLQVSYLGYPGTMGAPFMDYLVADETLIPEQSRCHYSEKIIYLPDSYQVNDSKRFMPQKSLPRGTYGLPEGAFVFCCFNNSYKITPSVFDAWMRILLRVPGSVLWLFEGSSDVEANLKAEANRRGVDPRRLVFANHLPLAEHLARLRAADLFLDTLPYNAHTTASDALWAGLPLLTCEGDSFVARVAASLLRAVGLPELIAADLREYEERAVALGLGGAVGELGALRKVLSENRLSAPLFDPQRFRRHLECAYLAISERHRNGMPPDHILVAAQ